MLHHIELYVRDLEQSIAFWTPFLTFLGYRHERWTGGISYFKDEAEAYLCLLPASPEHLAAGYHRKRIGLNHLAFRGESREQVDRITAWLHANGHTVLYPERHPYAGGPHCYAVFLEDPDRLKLEVVAPKP